MPQRASPSAGERSLGLIWYLTERESPWFLFQAECLHLLDPEMLDAVLAGPRSLLEGYDAKRLLPSITCPVLILQADRALGAMTDGEELGVSRHAG